MCKPSRIVVLAAKLTSHVSMPYQAHAQLTRNQQAFCSTSLFILILSYCLDCMSNFETFKDVVTLIILGINKLMFSYFITNLYCVPHLYTVHVF